MANVLSELFDTSGFPPRWYCGIWSDALGWLHIGSDLAIFGAYFAIPCVLAYFVVRRRDVPFPNVLWLFVIFILSCGFGHLLEAVIFWYPVYRLAGVVKLVTAIVSWGTVAALIVVIPTALKFPRLAKLNVELKQSNQKLESLAFANEKARLKSLADEAVARDQSARIQAILDGATDAIITINVEGIIESFNAAAEKTFGYAADEVIGKNVNILMPSPYHEEHDGHIQQYLATGISKILGIGREVFGRRADRTTFPMRLAVSEVNLGERRLFTGIVHDVTDVVQAKQQLATVHEQLARHTRQIERFNFDLKRSNEDLKQFAYVASHDLQEPLRKVAAFCQLLHDEYGDRLDNDARNYINHAVDGALRMRALIQDLLTYSRIEIQGKPLEPTDADDACAEAIRNLTVTIEEAAAEVTRDRLPVVNADRDQLARLFQNLIGNAIKYRGDQPPRIHVWAADADGQWEFRVRDNGIGIDPQYFERVFVIFQRLHAREEYAGTGIGLAVCKRIVERAGGRIWVESKLGAGSVFCFTLAKVNAVSSQGVPSHDRHTSQYVSTTD